MVRDEVDVQQEGFALIACSKCGDWNRGEGTKACLKCKRYREIQRLSVRRHTIRIEPVPQSILEAIPELDEGVDMEATDFILQHVNALPVRTAIVIHAYYKLGATDREIASQLQISKSNASEIRRKGIAALQAILKGEN